MIHRLLSGLATLLGAGFSVHHVAVEDFDRRRAEPNSVVLDVRTAEEFASGHIPGAVNMDWYAADFAARVARLDKTKTYLVHCAVGGRSAMACAKMRQLDFPNSFNLRGGFRAWQRAGKPVEQ